MISTTSAIVIIRLLSVYRLFCFITQCFAAEMNFIINFLKYKIRNIPHLWCKRFSHSLTALKYLSKNLISFKSSGKLNKVHVIKLIKHLYIYIYIYI